MDKRLRDELAMAALTGFLAADAVGNRARNHPLSWAREAYKWADAMLEARGREALEGEGE